MKLGIARYLSGTSRQTKTTILVVYDFCCSLIAFYLALCLKHGEFTALSSFKATPTMLFFFAAAQVSGLYASKSYRAVLRYASTSDLVRIFKGTLYGVGLSAVILLLWNRLDGIPRSALIIDWFLLFFAVGGGRLLYRVLRDGSNTKNKGTKTLIVGAGSAGVQLLREFRNNPNLKTKIVGFIDDNPRMKNSTILGAPVFGGAHLIPKLVKKLSVKSVIIAIPSASGDEMTRIVGFCKDLDIEISTLPKMEDNLYSKIDYSKVRKVLPEALLGRDSINLASKTIADMIFDKTIMVTGAGGSIGSRLCKEIASFKPKQIIFYEVSEFFLYQLENEIQALFPELSYVPIIGDVRSERSLESVFKTYQPQIVFHAAAYKHVPMIEKNPAEAIKTNCGGTNTLSELCGKYNVEKFVLISTDKAVNPTNVMGTTKRIAEIICQHKQEKFPATSYVTVRFGNVLGSNGSVIPLFQKQIEAGGPVTVTHPEITRYFMSIPEACQLVLQAGAMGRGGEIFVLDMGKSVKIVDLAKQMITLAGLKEGIDIEIVYTGLREGEKLYEELFANNETLIQTSHPKVRVATSRPIKDEHKDLIKDLCQARYTDGVQLRKSIQEIVPEYSPTNHNKIQ